MRPRTLKRQQWRTPDARSSTCVCPLEDSWRPTTTTAGSRSPLSANEGSRRPATLGADVVDVYVERGESAKTDDRPELQRMLARIHQQRDVDYVIVWKVSRLARNRRDDADVVFHIGTH